jgi:hypothetical protein
VRAFTHPRLASLARVVLLLSGLAIVATLHGEPAAAERLSPKLKVEKTRYRSGEEVRVKAERFDGKLVIDFKIKGVSESCKPDEVVAEGVVKANRQGNLDAILYMVQWDDCGWYQITASEGRKEARPVSFKVKGPADAPPEESPDDGLFEAKALAE